MQIIETPNGWRVEPTSSDERKSLAFLLGALREAYGKTAEVTSDSSPANRSLSSGEIPNRDASA